MEDSTMDNSYNPFLAILEKLNNIESKIVSTTYTTPDTTYLKIDKAADFLSTTANALRMMVHKDQIPFIKKQGKVYFLRSDLVTWLESGRNNSEEVNAEDILLGNKKRS
jgi:hypothetical protein